jgi:hypothetical protein
MNIQHLVDAISAAGERERSNYHATLGDLIDKLKNADDSLVISPLITGVGAYRGYYSDIALCTESDGNQAYATKYDYDGNTSDWEEMQKNAIKIDFAGTPKQIAEKLESLIGRYFDGYKGGFNEITREKPLWLATDYGDCSSMAIIDITDDLKLITKLVE